MSSILDALNKLEQEKAARQTEISPDDAPASPEEAAAELISESSYRSSAPRTTLAWAPVMAAAILGVAITSAAVIIAISLAATSTQTVAALPAVEAETPLVHTYSVPLVLDTGAATEEASTSASEMDNASLASVPSPVPAPATLPEPALRPAQTKPAPPAPEPVKIVEPVSAPVQTLPPPAKSTPEPRIPAQAPVTVPAAEPVIAAVPKPVEPSRPVSEFVETQQEALPDVATLMRQVEPAPAAPVEKRPALVLAQAPPRPAANTAPPIAVPPPAARTASGPVDLSNLPRLSVHDREYLGLDNIRLNVLRPADKDQPDALAIINLKKVYVGEMIPGTRARLIAVDSGAIGIEVEGDGDQKRFRIPR